MTRLQPFAITVEPELFNQVLEKIDPIAAKTKTNRSAVIRGILYEHFGIKVEKPVKVNRSHMELKKLKA